MALSLFAAAHGKPQRFLGTVKELTSNQLVITTTAGGVRAFEISSKTKFLKSGQPAKAKDLTVGERVVVEADVHGSKAIAEVVKFGKTPQEHSHQSNFGATKAENPKICRHRRALIFYPAE
jgi:hypothetical protein